LFTYCPYYWTDCLSSQPLRLVLFGGDMSQQKAAIVARRCRQSVTLSRVATWLSFGTAVLSQAAFLTAGYLLTDDLFPNALRNAALAGGLALAGLAVMIFARWVGKRAQSSAVNFGREPLRLVPDAVRSDVGQRSRRAG
jgi:hypothetical protein